MNVSVEGFSSRSLFEFHPPEDSESLTEILIGRYDRLALAKTLITLLHLIGPQNGEDSCTGGDCLD